MRAAIYLGKEAVEVRRLPDPVCGAEEVLLQPICSSICGTDVAVYTKGPNTGHRITVGGEFGHETVCRIAAAGSHVTEFQVGERVYPYPLYAKGDPRRAGTIGGFSEYILIPHPKRDHSLYAVPDAIPDQLACLIEPFTVGCRAARRGQPQPGEQGVVFGCGTIGLAAAIALQHFGMEKVMVCDVSDFRLSIAARLGFAVCNPAKESFPEAAAAYFGTAPALSGTAPRIDCWIDAAGAESVLDTFMAHGKIISRFVAVAVNNKPRQIDLLHMTYAQKSIIGSGGYFPEDVRDVFSIMTSGRWDLSAMVTHQFPLEEIDQALRTAADPSRALNVTITF